MCFSIGELDMKVSRLLFASLLCGVIGVDVMAFNEGNTEVNNGSQVQDAEDIEQGRAHGGGQTEGENEVVHQESFPAPTVGGGTENGPRVVQELHFGTLTRVHLDITEHVHYILYIANAVRNAIAGHISGYGDAITEIRSILKNPEGVVVACSCKRGLSSNHATCYLIHRMYGMLVELLTSTQWNNNKKIMIKGADVDCSRIMINDAAVDCSQIMDSYSNIFLCLQQLASIDSTKISSSTDLESVYKYMNDLLYILNNLKANPLSTSIDMNISRLYNDISEFCDDRHKRVDVAVQTGGNDLHGRLPAQNRVDVAVQAPGNQWDQSLEIYGR
jgi:hypothetical protein